MIKLARQLVIDILGHALSGHPHEVCGLVGGNGDRACCVRQVKNAAQNPAVRFQMDPHEQLRVLQAFENAGWELLAIYHSHPNGPAHPSETDVAEFAEWCYPGVLTLIVSLDSETPNITAWRIQNGQAIRAEIQQVEANPC